MEDDDEERHKREKRELRAAMNVLLGELKRKHAVELAAAQERHFADLGVLHDALIAEQAQTSLLRSQIQELQPRQRQPPPPDDHEENEEEDEVDDEAEEKERVPASNDIPGFRELDDVDDFLDNVRSMGAEMVEKRIAEYNNKLRETVRVLS